MHTQIVDENKLMKTQPSSIFCACIADTCLYCYVLLDIIQQNKRVSDFVEKQYMVFLYFVCNIGRLCFYQLMDDFSSTCTVHATACKICLRLLYTCRIRV